MKIISVLFKTYSSWCDLFSYLLWMIESTWSSYFPKNPQTSEDTVYLYNSLWLMSTSLYYQFWVYLSTLAAWRFESEQDDKSTDQEPPTYSYVHMKPLQSMFMKRNEVTFTGCSIKIQLHYFNLTSSHKRSTSKFKTTFIYYYIGLSFELYNSFLGQLV